MERALPPSCKPSHNANAVMRACCSFFRIPSCPNLLLACLLLLALSEKRLVLLLGLDERLLESVGVCRIRISIDTHASVGIYSLSLLAKRMARVCASGSPSLTSAAAFQTQLRSLPTLGDSFMSGTTMHFLVCVTVPAICVSYRSGWRRP
jgi:hypothetical protein